MPAGKLAEHFDPQMGRPTKELDSVAGLLFIMEFRNLTHEEAADACMFSIDTAADFQVELRKRTDEYGRVELVPTCVACPAGIAPHRSFFDSWQDQNNILQHPEVCASCPLRQSCPTCYADGWTQWSSGGIFKHPAEGRRLESPSSRQPALTGYKIDENWSGLGFCDALQ